jgi:hypothetical protein
MFWEGKNAIDSHCFIIVMFVCDRYHTLLIESYLYYNGIQYESVAIKVYSRKIFDKYISQSRDSLYQQHHVGCHYGDLIRYLAPMIHLSCEKFDSAHRVIVKRGLRTTQGRFNDELVIERVM